MKKASAQKAYIEPSKCDGSPLCPARRSCPQKAITQKGKGAAGFFGGGIAEVNRDLCTGCGLCLNYCPRGAISLVS